MSFIEHPRFLYDFNHGRMISAGSFRGWFVDALLYDGNHHEIVHFETYLWHILRKIGKENYKVKNLFLY